MLQDDADILTSRGGMRKGIPSRKANLITAIFAYANGHFAD